jgi:hypothetical protein
MRRSHSLAIPLEFAARHREFVARLRNRREEGVRTPPIGRVLRRSMQRVLHRVRTALHFALHVFQRASAPWNPPRPVVAPPSPGAAPVVTRERSYRMTRIVERASHVLHVRHSHMLVTVAPPAIAVAASTAPSPRVLMTQRIERQTLFPRVTQVVARAPAAPVVRGEAAMHAPPQVVEPRSAPRTSAPHTVAIIAPTLPPAELSRVTDHVIEQLDRRVLSYRERMGQV